MERNIKRTSRNILLGLAALCLAACSNQTNTEGEKAGDYAIAVKTETVAATPLANQITVSGNIEGTTTVQLGFMVPGRISHVAIKEGQFVTKGQMIAALDATNYLLNKQLADVQLSEVDDEYGRLKLLHSRGSLSESDFIKIGFSRQKALLQLQLEAKSLNDTKLYTPIGGVLLSKKAEAGEIIAAGTPLFMVADIKKVKVLAFIPESEFSGLHIGKLAQVSIAALGKTFTGKIIEVGSLAEASSRAFTIKIEVDNTGLQIRPGMIAEAKIDASGQGAAIQLPVESVLNGPGNQSLVYVTDGARHAAFQRKVSLGKVVANKIEILSGLSIGETVITSGQTKLSDGSLITIEK